MKTYVYILLILAYAGSLSLLAVSLPPSFASSAGLLRPEAGRRQLLRPIPAPPPINVDIEQPLAPVQQPLVCRHAKAGELFRDLPLYIPEAEYDVVEPKLLNVLLGHSERSLNYLVAGAVSGGLAFGMAAMGTIMTIIRE